MKKIIIIYLICIIVLFFLPVFFVKEQQSEKEYLEQNNRKIKVLLTDTEEIIEIDLDDYIMGVIVGEMPVSYELEALKAQAIVARTYTLNKLNTDLDSHLNADMCDDINHCQAYKTKEYALSCWDDKEEQKKWAKIKKAVLDTKDEVITYDGNLINAFFHANSGGKTEDISNIWGKENIPYLKSVETIYETEIKEKVNLSYDEINKKMK